MLFSLIWLGRERGFVDPYFRHDFIYSMAGNYCHGDNLAEPIAEQLAASLKEALAR